MIKITSNNFLKKRVSISTYKSLIITSLAKMLYLNSVFTSRLYKSLIIKRTREKFAKKMFLHLDVNRKQI